MGKKPRHQEVLLDIVYEILLRLPVKSLSRFHCVCKLWYSLISCPSFQEDYHRRRSEQNPFLETRTDLDKGSHTTTLHLSTYNDQGIHIKEISKKLRKSCMYNPVQSCLGMGCIAPCYGMDDNPIFLFDSYAEELITLPPTEGVASCIGFGYVASTNEFKVVRFFSHEFGGFDDGCEVFTLGASNWREARCSNFPSSLRYSFEYGAAPFLHGALHLLPTDFGYPECEEHFIYAFDIENEEATTISLPNNCVQIWFPSMPPMYLRVLAGSLCLFFEFKTSLVFWRLNDYHSGNWGKECTINLKVLGSKVRAEPLTIMVDGSMLMNIGVDGDKYLYSYNFRDKTFRLKQRRERLFDLIYKRFMPKVKLSLTILNHCY